MSKKLKLSPWHDGSVKPVHVGVYEIKRYDTDAERIKIEDNVETMFSYFDGDEWRGWESKEEFNSGSIPSFNHFLIYGQGRSWRGVMK